MMGLKKNKVTTRIENVPGVIFMETFTVNLVKQLRIGRFNHLGYV